MCDYRQDHKANLCWERRPFQGFWPCQAAGCHPAAFKGETARTRHKNWRQKRLRVVSYTNQGDCIPLKSALAAGSRRLGW